MLVRGLQVVSNWKTDNQYPHPIPIPGNVRVCGGGGSGYLYLPYWPIVDWEPAVTQGIAEFLFITSLT